MCECLAAKALYIRSLPSPAHEMKSWLRTRTSWWQKSFVIAVGLVLSLIFVKIGLNAKVTIFRENQNTLKPCSSLMRVIFSSDSLLTSSGKKILLFWTLLWFCRRIHQTQSILNDRILLTGINTSGWNFIQYFLYMILRYTQILLHHTNRKRLHSAVAKLSICTHR